MSENWMVGGNVIVWPAYRRGFFVTNDLNTRWPGSFEWLVTVGGPKGIRMGWFGSLESAYTWIYKQEERTWLVKM